MQIIVALVFFDIKVWNVISLWGFDRVRVKG